MSTNKDKFFHAYLLHRFFRFHLPIRMLSPAPHLTGWVWNELHYCCFKALSMLPIQNPFSSTTCPKASSLLHRQKHLPHLIENQPFHHFSVSQATKPWPTLYFPQPKILSCCQMLSQSTGFRRGFEFPTWWRSATGGVYHNLSLFSLSCVVSCFWISKVLVFSLFVG